MEKDKNDAPCKKWDHAVIFRFSFNSPPFLILSAVRIRLKAELQIISSSAERGKHFAQEATGTE